MSTDDSAAPPSDAQAELERLRSEVARLEAETGASPTDRTGAWRPVVAGILVMIVALLAPLSVLATWAHGQIDDTDRFIATVGPLADDPDVQDAVAARLEQVLYSYLDIDAATEALVSAVSQTGLPAPVVTTLQAVVGPLTAAIRSFVSEQIHAFVESDNFQDAWVAANREAHSQVVAALTGGGDAVTVKDGQVTIGLATMIEAVKAQLVDAGFALADRIPEVDATFTIFESADLGTVQKLLGLIDDLSTWLPVIGLGLLGVAIAIARDRRRVIFAAGLAVAGSMLLLGAALNVMRPFYLDALPASSNVDAAGVLFDQVVSFIRLALRGLLVMGIAIAIGAWLSAPRGTGAAARTGIVRVIDAVRRGGGRAGLSTGGLGVFLRRYRAAIRTAVLAVGALWYLSIDHPTGNTALGLVIVVVVILLLTELLAAGPEADQPAVEVTADETLNPGK